MKRLALLLTVLGLLIFAGTASANVTVQMSLNCSTTAYTPYKAGSIGVFLGGVSCAGGGRSKSANTCAQVRGASGQWFTIANGCTNSGWYSGNPDIVGFGTNGLVSGHVYRSGVVGVACTGPGGTGTCTGAYVDSQSFTWP